MLKKMFIGVAALLLSWSLNAQNLGSSNTVIPGANGAKTVLLGKATGAFPEFLSADTNFLSGVYAGAAGYAYDFKKDTCMVFLESTLAGYISANHYVGQNDPADTYADSYVYYNGKKYPLEKVLESDKVWGEVFVTAVQGNGDNIVAMVYEEYTKADKTQLHFNYPAIYDGKTGKHLYDLPYAWSYDKLIDEDKIGFGARGDCISADGKIIGGHSTNPKAKSNWSLAFWDISDPNDIKVFGLGAYDLTDTTEDGTVKSHGIPGLDDKSFGFGSFYGINSEGTVLVGGSESNGKGVILHYDRTNKTVSKIDTIAPLLSWDFVTFTDVSDNGLAIGYCGMSLDPGTREPVVYHELIGLLKMSDFLYEYYNIDVRRIDLYTPMKVSQNGRRIIGFNFESPTIPYSHELSEKRILPRARQITARAYRGEQKAVITWQQPFWSQKTLTGYNVYRDDATTPLNETLIAATEGTDAYEYEDENVAAGKHTYYIEAVYGTEKSFKQPSNIVQVVAEGQAFPVQSINHRVEHNRFATIYWGVPSSEVVALAQNDVVAPSKKPVGKFEYAVEDLEAPVTETATKETVNLPSSKSYINTTLDYIANVDMLTYSGFGAIQVGDYYYTSSHLGGGITIFDQFNKRVGNIRSAQLGIVLSMYYDEAHNWLYCGSNQAIKVLDLNTRVSIPDANYDTAKVIYNWNFPGRFLTYVPDIDGKGHEGFVAGSMRECNTYLLEYDETTSNPYDLKVLEKNFLNFSSLYAQGAAYYKGSDGVERLYVSSATGPYYNEVHVFDFKKKQRIGDPIQVVEDPALFNLLTQDGSEYFVANMSTISQAGGLSIVALEDETTALGMVFQCNYMTSRFMLLELESAPTVAGYDLWRSAKGGAYAQVNSKTLTTRRYTETMTEAGKYTYYVVAKSEGGKDPADKSPVDTVTIANQGTCPEADFTAKESNGWTVLDWMPKDSDKELVGFDLYRDDTHLGRFWGNNITINYTDQVSKLGTYNYRLETLYTDGCVATSKQTITLTGEGVAKGPFGLTYTSKLNDDLSTYEVKTTWETPMFEEPLSLRYCNGLAGAAIGFENFYQCMGVIGWNGNDLKPYRDLYLVGMEYMIGAVPSVYEAIVIINDEIVHKQAIKQLVPREWRTVMFDKSFSMDQKDEVSVGFNTRYAAESAEVLAVDPTVTVNGKSNMVSLDGGENWSSLQAGGVTGSWLLGALVVHKRDLEAAKNADGTVDPIKLSGSVMRMALEGEPLKAKVQTLPNATFTAKPSTKAPLTLTGFNVYRQKADSDEPEVKLNDQLMTTFELTDSKVAAGEYDYFVGAVYGDGKEVRSTVFVDLKRLANEDGVEALSLNVYPNPATEWINVEGEYETLQIFDLAGRLLRTSQAATQIRLGDLKPGTYMLHFTGANARKAVYKIVVR